jgi:predicted nucleic acid-binding protein
MARYYFDSATWRDFYENRFGPKGRPLGGYAARLIMKIISQKDEILFSDLVIDELSAKFNKEEINEMFDVLSHLKILKKVDVIREQMLEFKRIAIERAVPPYDAAHAVIARDSNAIIVSQDKHFEKLKDIAVWKKPDELV